MDSFKTFITEISEPVVRRYMAKAKNQMNTQINRGYAHTNQDYNKLRKRTAGLSRATGVHKKGGDLPKSADNYHKLVGPGPFVKPIKDLAKMRKDNLKKKNQDRLDQEKKRKKDELKRKQANLDKM